MSDAQVQYGVEVGAVVPTRTASVAAAIERVAGRPVLVEALVEGPRLQVHRRGDEVLLFGDPAGDHEDAVRAAVADLDADSVVVDAVVADGLVRFTDLLWLNGVSWVGRPTVERLDELAEIAPVKYMVERMAVEVPAWAASFVEHIRERGVPGASLRLSGAPRVAGDAGDAWQVVAF